MSAAEATVFVVDDDASLRRSTERLVRTMELGVRTFASGQEFLEFIGASRLEGPACVLLDVKLPGPSGLDLQRELAGRGARIPIIFLTGRGSIPMSVRAMRDGAFEFLTKPVRSRDLIDAIRAAIARDRALQEERRELAVLRERYARLTPREREVMAHVVAGLLNKQIAGELDASERTVKFHRAHVMKKMQAESLADLVRMAARLGLERPGATAPVPEDR
jgi:FixJ family two-component response regulator